MRLAAAFVLLAPWLPSHAQQALTISSCDDAALWRGVTPESGLVKEGAGAIRWVPSDKIEASTDAIPHDWTAGNCLHFWMHSAKATGSRLTLILSSEDPTREGMDYFAASIRADWEGWKEFWIPFAEMGRVRSPVGWNAVSSFRCHAAWDPAMKANPEDTFVLDDIRVVTRKMTGAPLTDEEFFAALDLSRPGLEDTQQAVEAKDFEGAKAAFRRHFLARRDVKWFTNWWERPPVPEKRPNTAAADETLRHVFNFNGKKYDLGPDIDWASNQENQGEAATIEWNASLNRHFFFRSLADAYWNTLDDKYPAEIVAMIEDWVNDSPALLFQSGNSPYHYAWETLNTAIRAGDTWVEAIWRTADAPAWTPEALCTALKSLVQHARHLLKWPTSANWLTAESKAIVALGTLLPELKEADEWRKTGIERLYGQMEKEVYPDGIENELALGYGLWVLAEFAQVLDLEILNGRRDEIPADYQARLERMYNYVLYAQAPDRTVPGFNDSWSSNPQALLQKGYEYFPARLDFLWGATRGKEGRAPEATSYAFPYSGHYAMRSGWEPDARFLFADAGPFGSGHQHEDKLTFFMNAHGRQWITEGGVYMYDASRWRRYVLSTRAHNTVRVDGQDQNRRAARETYVLPYPFQPLDNPWITNAEFDYLRGIYEDGYGPKRDIRVRHQREFIFVKPDYWIIVDTLQPADDAEHEYETIYHINAEDASVEGTTVLASAGQTRLGLFGFGPGLSVEIVKGREEEPVQGWGPGCKQAIPTALFRNKASGAVCNVYVLYPSSRSELGIKVAPLETSQPAVALGELPDVGLRIACPDGTTHCFVRRGAPEAPGSVTRLGPVTTDADVCVVKVTAEGQVTGVFALGGERVEIAAP